MNISRNDNRTYHALTLDNGLKVLLVQDKDSTKAAASMAINAGHFDDPLDRQGLAHFLEHMLFLGTDQYPESNGFSNFVSQAGGNTNAWTGTEHTCYFFDINNQKFEHALKQFSRFFIAPLLSPTETEKERNAIDAEFKLKIKDDSRRIYQAHKETVNPDHPFAKFSVGSQQTLADRETCISDELRQFFNTYYQAQWMSLVLCSDADITTMERWVTDLFCDIKGTGKEKPAIEADLYRQQDLCKVLHIEPHKHMQKLIVSFAMPNIDAFYRHKTVSFIAHLLGYEGEGSLYSILKEQGWINALSAGGGINGSNFKDFNISMALTDEGIEYYEDIVEMVFEYICLITQNTDKLPRLYQDKKNLLSIAFDNQEKARLIDWVSNLSINMQHYDEASYVQGDYLMEGFNQHAHDMAMQWLTPRNMRLVLIHPDVEPEHKTKWYHTPYRVEALSNSWLDALTEINTPLPQMLLPTANPYLTKDVTLLDVEHPKTQPTLLVKEPGFDFWFKQDNTFRVAKGHFYLAMDSHFAVKDIKHMALTRLFADLFMDSVAEQFYPAELAGLSYHLTSHQGGLTLHTAGLSSSQLALVDELLNALFNVEICAKRFAEYKKQLVRHWRNSNHNKPVGELFSVLGAKVMPWNPQPDQLANALKDTSFHQFNRFRKEFFNALHVESFLHGNWQENDALEFQKEVANHLAKSATIEDLTRPLCLLDKVTRIELELNCNDNAMVIYYQAMSDDVDEKIKMMALNHLINQDYFNELRTKQQLGYLVGAGYAPFNTRAGIAFYVQSPEYSPYTLLERHEEFITRAVESLNQLEAEQWQIQKQGLKTHIAEKDKNLRLRSQRLWLAIGNQDHTFNMQKKLLSALEALTIDEIKAYIRETFNDDRARYELLSHPKAKKLAKDSVSSHSL
ncbi:MULTISPECIES: insulinase family protein [unclassified Pseudoalteromonas]|uniref:insulinase family protein n=1 Tax=unclassified Pseudoalteromonas TaxID=194690 RepID=UPI000C0766DD|nr:MULTISPECIES: insulinase family protein [unclassified Pseudoalteromonas]MDP2636470.1 insulinase family protein [Pseudoalteromonas sp. 1_MG-2023]PHN88371.1 peptidase M16 [Pseudoalteromonas sp. 3D05]